MLPWILHVKFPMNTYQGDGSSLGKIISIESKHQFTLTICFSNGDSLLAYCDLFRIALFSGKLLSYQ